ncbi:uncharacterized protein ISCGN_018152 [Ixodes scapularis]
MGPQRIRRFEMPPSAFKRPQSHIEECRYTLKWYDTDSQEMKSKTQYVQAVKQKDYSIENIMHLACEFWLREDWVKKNLSIPEVQNEESEKNEEESGNADKTTYLYDSLFKQLPSSCRYAFLLNCGKPTSRIYDKKDCDKMNEKENAASGDTNGSG